MSTPLRWYRGLQRAAELSFEGRPHTATDLEERIRTLAMMHSLGGRPTSHGFAPTQPIIKRYFQAEGNIHLGPPFFIGIPNRLRGRAYPDAWFAHLDESTRYHFVIMVAASEVPA